MIANTHNGLTRVGIAGAGYIAQWHAKVLQRMEGVQLVSVADVSLGQAERLAHEFGIDSCYPSVDEMLEAEDLDAVHVLVPPQHHELVASACMRRGVHVLLEKPMATDADACRRIEQVAQDHQVVLGINHNFMFSAVYQQLRDCIQSGQLGRLDAIDVAWNKPLPQLIHGPFSIWMLREPQNLLKELGPHVLSPILDLAGEPDDVAGLVSNAIRLPTNQIAYRNWAISMRCGRTSIQARMTLGMGINEFLLRVRGTHGVATCDFENDTFVLERATGYSIDVDRFVRLRSNGRALRQQAVGGFRRYIGNKLGLVEMGNPYGDSIFRSIASFYRSIDDQDASTDEPIENGLSGRLGSRVTALCESIWDSIKEDTAATTSLAPPSGDQNPASQPSARVEVQPRNGSRNGTYLVLGGTGFIGRALAKCLTEQGHHVRALVRRPDGLPEELRDPNVETVVGDMQSDASMRDAIADVDGVFHLARGNGKTWEDYMELDIKPSIRIAEICQDRKIRLVYTSSIDSFYAGRNAGTITESTPLDHRIRRRNLYAQSKSVVESELRRLHHQRGLDVVITRPGIVIGKGGSPFHWGVGMWNNESVCQVWGSGDTPLPLVLVDDVGRGLIAAMMNEDASGRCFNFVARPSLTARDYLSALEQAVGAKIDVRPTKIWHFYINDLMKWSVKTAIRHPERRFPSYHDWESRTQRAHFDCSSTRDILGWCPIDDRDQIIHKGIDQPTLEIMA